MGGLLYVISSEDLKAAGRAVVRDIRRLRDDESGVTAIEFGMVAVPFLMFVFGIISLGLFFFVTFSLENGVEQAARLVRTGQAQTANMTTDEFKQRVCDQLPTFVDCTNKLRVSVVEFTTFAGISEPQCTDAGGSLIPEGAAANVPGAAGQVVLVTACYEWGLAGEMPFLKLGNMGNGAALIRASTTFRTEPFE